MTKTMEPRKRWTDDRLDDLNKKVDCGFVRVENKIDIGLAEVRADIREGKSEVNDLKAEVNARFDSMNRSMWAGIITIVAALIGSNATLALLLS
jgi:hypothetical protein